MKGFVLVTPDKLMDLRTFEATEGAAKQHRIDIKGDDGKFHQWSYWHHLGWRCKGAELFLRDNIEAAPTTIED